MNFRNALLGTTAMLGATALVMPSTASAFDVNINGFQEFNTWVGDIEESGNGGADPKDYDFVVDTEIHVQGVNVDDETGIRYGMLVEFEADTNASVNTDEAWIFIDGAFGGFRLGDEDGAVANSRIGAMDIASGTGGIDGEGLVAPVALEPNNSGDSTKIRYDSPSIAGFTAHASFAPSDESSGQDVAQDNETSLQEFVETALVYTGSFGGLDLQAGGALGFADGEGANDDDYVGWNLGGIVGFQGFRVAGSYWQEDDAPGTGDQTGFTAGAAATLGPADLSVTYAGVVDADNDEEGDNLVLSASVGVLPGMALQGDVAFFDRDAGGNDDGVTGVARLRIGF